ncbi:hypothetical protein CRE_29219, partial [Caenorhabditis remanei]
GLPSRIRIKLLERETPADLDEAVEIAERMEDIMKEEDRDTINLIDQVRKTDRREDDESLRNQLRELAIESKKQRRMIEQLNENQGGFNNSRGFPNQRGFFTQRGGHFSRGHSQPNEQGGFRGHGYQNQRNFGPQRGPSNYGRNTGNRGNSYTRGGWQPNRAPTHSGVHFLMIVACLALFIPGATGQFQICPNVRSGEYFAPPPQMSCELNPIETVVKATVDIYTEYGAAMKAKAYRCSKTTYTVCSYTGWLEWFVRKPNIANITTAPMTKMECENAVDHHQVGNQTLISKVLKWDEKLPLVIQSYNASYHSSVKYSPEYIVFGRMTVSPTDIMIKTLRPIYRDEEDMVENLSESIRQCHAAVYGELENSLRNAKKAHDKIRKVRVPIFEVGEKVVIQNPTAKKLMYQFSPPVTIVSLTASTITIRTDRGKVETVHKNRVKKFNEARPERDDCDDDLGSETSATEGSIGSMAPSMHQNKYGSFDGEMGQHDWMEKEVIGWSQRDRASTGDGQQHPGQLRRSRRLQNLPAELDHVIS